MEPQWKYEEYNDWSRRLALIKPKEEIEKRLMQIGGEINSASASHLRAIQRTGSMSSNSQARAHGRNVISGLGEEKMALKNALEIYQFWPEKTFDGPKVAPQEIQDK